MPKKRGPEFLWICPDGVWNKPCKAKEDAMPHCLYWKSVPVEGCKKCPGPAKYAREDK